MSAANTVKKADTTHAPHAVDSHEPPKLHAVPDAHETPAADGTVDETQESTHAAATEAAKIDTHATPDAHETHTPKPAAHQDTAQEKPHTDTPAESHVTSHTSQVLQPPEGFFGKAAFYGKKFWSFLQALIKR